MPALSEKQLQILAFPYTDYDVLICDGAVRSGKSSIMTVAFVDWAMSNFNNCNFILAGKTVGSCRKNIVQPYIVLDYAKKYKLEYKRSENLLIVSKGKTTNNFYIYGGKDESSQDLIQGLTAAGALMDEVALMPESFVNQATARCSVRGARLWFNCNPENPKHFFYEKWVCQTAEKNALHLHFTMKDNPSLDEKTLKRYESMYTGVFHDRYIKGLWVRAEGLIYPQFKEELHVVDELPEKFSEIWISMDYGIQNATAMGLWGKADGKWWMIKEFHHSGRESKNQKTDAQYYDDLEKLAEGHNVKGVIIDPSASSFIALIIQKRKFRVLKAKNDVLHGIGVVGNALFNEQVKIHRSCKNMISELNGYSWDEKSQKDQPLKVNDHQADQLRYLCATLKVGNEWKSIVK